MKNKSDPNMYVEKDEKRKTILISLYVDDLIIKGSKCKLIEEIKSKLSQEFEMKELGELYYYLGLEVWREPSKTLITQSKYTRGILKRFNMSECKVVSTPLE